MIALGLIALVPVWLTARATPLCTPILMAGGRDRATTYFIGRALRDTVLTGPGMVRFEMRSGHWGRPTGRPIFGQVVAVEQVGGAGLARLRAAFARAGSRRVIAVPWDYDSACAPVPWVRSARWVAAADAGFYRGRLRPESLWVDRRPVVDVFYADTEPYPHGLLFQSEYRGTDTVPRESLTPREYFDFFAVLPDLQQSSRDPAATRAALHALDAWEASNPELARKYPAAQSLPHVRTALRPR